MPSGSRNIDEVLNFRSDISPFLVHLTRKTDATDSAKETFKLILSDQELRCINQVSDARFGIYTSKMNPEEKLRFFGAVCFTETPLNEIHCLLEIENRAVELEPYGLVFLKDKLRNLGVAPVLYLNNIMGDKQDALSALGTLARTHRNAAEELLPLISIFGKKVTSPGASSQTGSVDFLWEREWRYPHSKGPLSFNIQDHVFIGLCPHEEIEYFENLGSGIEFVDPRRNMKWYAKKLIKARRNHDLKVSVV